MFEDGSYGFAFKKAWKRFKKENLSNITIKYGNYNQSFSFLQLIENMSYYFRVVEPFKQWMDSINIIIHSEITYKPFKHKNLVQRLRFIAIVNMKR